MHAPQRQRPGRCWGRGILGPPTTFESGRPACSSGLPAGGPCLLLLPPGRGKDLEPHGVCTFGNERRLCLFPQAGWRGGLSCDLLVLGPKGAPESCCRPGGKPSCAHSPAWQMWSSGGRHGRPSSSSPVPCLSPPSSTCPAERPPDATSVVRLRVASHFPRPEAGPSEQPKQFLSEWQIHFSKSDTSPLKCSTASCVFAAQTPWTPRCGRWASRGARGGAEG